MTLNEYTLQIYLKSDVYFEIGDTVYYESYNMLGEHIRSGVGKILDRTSPDDTKMIIHIQDCHSELEAMVVLGLSPFDCIIKVRDAEY